VKPSFRPLDMLVIRVTHLQLPFNDNYINSQFLFILSFFAGRTDKTLHILDREATISVHDYRGGND